MGGDPIAENNATLTDSVQKKRLPGETLQATGVTTRLLAAIAVVMVGSSISAGYGLVVLNTPQEIIADWVTRTVHAEYGHNLTETEATALWAAIVSVFVAGATVAAAGGAWIADRMGRRKALLFNHCLNLVSALFFLICRPAGAVELLVLGRFLSGATAGLATSIVPLYLSEIAPSYLAGVMGVLMPFGLTFGILVSQILGMQNFMGTEALWPYLLAMNGALGATAIVFHALLPESPAYLYFVLFDDVRGRKELCKLRGASRPDQVEMEEMVLKTEAKKNSEKKEETWTLSRIIRTPELQMPLAVAVILPLGQQFSGINAVFYYSTSIFHNAGLDLHQSQMVAIGTGVVNFALSLSAVYLIRVCPRRMLFLTSVALSMACQVALILCLRLTPYYSEAGVAGMIAVMAFVLFFGLGLGPVPYMVGTEVFPPGPRGVGLAMGGMANWIGNLTVGLTFPLLQALLGEFSFCFFIGCSTFLWLFAYLCLPETLQRKTSSHQTTEKDLSII